MDPIQSDLLKIGAAYLMALPIGWDREREAHTAGIRTFPIVALATCGATIAAQSMPNTLPNVLQGILTGIGFVGGGAILRDKLGVTGTATAASVWNMGIVGAACGLGQYHVAGVLAAVNFLTLKALAPVKRVVDREAEAEAAAKSESPQRRAGD